jgi:molybdopterin converting factor small subunit
MTISINFIGFQKNQTQTNRVRVRLSEKVEVVADLFGLLKDMYPDLILRKDAVLVTVNNNATSLDHRLRANDEISFIPHIGGG